MDNQEKVLSEASVKPEDNQRDKVEKLVFKKQEDNLYEIEDIFYEMFVFLIKEH